MRLFQLPDFDPMSKTSVRFAQMICELAPDENHEV